MPKSGILHHQKSLPLFSSNPQQNVILPKPSPTNYHKRCCPHLYSLLKIKAPCGDNKAIRNFRTPVANDGPVGIHDASLRVARIELTINEIGFNRSKKGVVTIEGRIGASARYSMAAVIVPNIEAPAVNINAAGEGRAFHLSGRARKDRKIKMKGGFRRHKELRLKDRREGLTKGCEREGKKRAWRDSMTQKRPSPLASKIRASPNWHKLPSADLNPITYPRRTSSSLFLCKNPAR